MTLLVILLKAINVRDILHNRIIAYSYTVGFNTRYTNLYYNLYYVK